MEVDEYEDDGDSNSVMLLLLLLLLKSNTYIIFKWKYLFYFNRWSTWMWANKEMIELVEWLKLYNDKKQLQEQKTNSFTSNFNSNGNGKKDWWILWSGS